MLMDIGDVFEKTNEMEVKHRLGYYRGQCFVRWLPRPWFELYQGHLHFANFATVVQLRVNISTRSLSETSVAAALALSMSSLFCLSQ